MIEHVNGHWCSRLTKKDHKKVLDEVLGPDLTEKERSALKLLLSDYQNMIDSDRPSLLDVASQDQWEEVPIPIEEWLESDYHLGDIKDSIFPKLKEDIISLFNGNYYEAIFTGCIDKNALVTCSDGSMPTLGSLIDKTTELTTLDPISGVQQNKTIEGQDSGVQKVLHLTLSNGMNVKLTPDHKVYTQRGWVRADELQEAFDRVIVPRKLTYNPSCHDLSNDEVKLIAYWITGGSSDDYRARYCGGSRQTSEEVIECLNNMHFNVADISPYKKNGAWEVHFKNFVTSGLRDWMKGRGIFGMKTKNAEVPDCICRSPLEQIALFINRVWTSQGTIYAGNNNSPRRFQLGMSSEKFISQIQLLLLRFGILSSYYPLVSKRNGKESTTYICSVSGKDNIDKFHKFIGTIYSKEEECRASIDSSKYTITDINNDLVNSTHGQTFDILKDNSISSSNAVSNPISYKERSTSRNMINAFCEDFNHINQVSVLENTNSDEITYSKVKSIQEVAQPIPVADIGVPGPNRFMANGMCVHNSIGW